MAAKNGSLSINSENIFPIIKKWLYSDHDIFYRELISNGCDAVTKLKKLDMMGEYALPEGYKGRVDVIVDPEKKTLTFKDNGLGMTDDEVEEYINQIAFSGATDFIEKYKDKSNSDQIIGHFGLGFYSAFMVADEVHIDTLSYKDGAKAVHWECDGGTEFSMEDGDKTDVGTTITLFLNEDCLEFCNEYKAREVVKKYCSFMPTEIYLSKANTKETQIIKEEEKRATAYHEAGHAIVEHFLPTQDPVHQISIIPSGRALGYTLSLPSEDKNSIYKNEMLESIASLLGGRVAEKLMLKDVSAGASNDIQRATEIARKMVTQYGMSDRLGPIVFGTNHDEVFLGRDFSTGRNYSEKIASEIDDEIHSIITGAFETAERILTEHLEQMKFIAEYLVGREVMDRDQFLAVFEEGATFEKLDAIKEEKVQKSKRENEEKRRKAAEEEAAKAAEPQFIETDEKSDENKPGNGSEQH